jgi:hypothetical protein
MLTTGVGVAGRYEILERGEKVMEYVVQEFPLMQEQ